MTTRFAMGEAAAELDALAEEFYPVWFRFHPEQALRIGVPGYEDRLPAMDDDEIGALGAWLENLIVALQELDFQALDPDRRIDHQLMFAAAQTEHRDLLEWDWRHRDPLRFLPVAEIFRLTLQPTAEFRSALLSLLRAVPEYLRHARGQLLPMAEMVAPLLVTAAMDEADAGIAYLRELSSSAWLRHRCHTCGEIQADCDAAVEALAGYLDLLSQEIAPRASGMLGCGESYLGFLLEKRHFLEFPLERLRVFLEALYQDTFRQLEAQAATQSVGGEPGFVLAYLTRQYAFSGESRLQVYKEECSRLRDFVKAREDLFSLPAARLKIMEKPLCPRPGVCDSGYVADRARAEGTFYIARQEAAGGGEGEPRALIRDRCLAEGWTGQHLLAFAQEAPASHLARRLAAGTGLDCGWDLYIRQQLLAAGYCGREDRLLQLVRRLQRIRLALLDLEIHVYGLAADQALDHLGAFEPEPGRAAMQLVQLVRHPSDALAAVLSWVLLFQSRRLLEEQSADFSPAEFHDQLLAHGSVPIPVLLPRLFGEALWRQVKEETLG